MAKYTIELRELLNDPETKTLIDNALSKYPLYTPKNNPAFTKIVTREELNKKLLNHYKFREIGFETPRRFIDELEIAMDEIMPYYNQLLMSEDIINGIDDIFGNVNVTETYSGSSNGSTNSTYEGSTSEESTDSSTGKNTESNQTSNTQETSSSSTNENNSEDTSKQIKTDTPQDELSITAKNIDNVSYANEVNWDKKNNSTSGESSENSSTTGSTTTNNEVNTTNTMTGSKTGTIENTQTGTSNNKNDYTLTKKGNQGVNTYAHDMLEFRELFINVTQQIINDKRIKELFMLIW